MCGRWLVLFALVLGPWDGASGDSCTEGFVVHRDKIIRTVDSTEMGAKFLNELDVDTRQECMRWCCETQHCDVFIFEEKKPGSCYLFHCGPPLDFKCKFTSHANYSSAVLQNYADLQNADALEEQIRRNQQEHQLKSLRKPEPPSREYDYFVTNPPTRAPTTTTTTTTTLAPIIVGPRCSRNQFECRSNDDCIAIYNVCDGIPQCADGSDEAAELGCPTDKTTPAPPPPVVGPTPRPPYVPLLPDVIRYQQQMMQEQQHVQYPMIYPGQEAASKDWANQLRRQQHQEVNYEAGGGYVPPNNYKPEVPPRPPPYQWNNNNNNYDPAVVYEQQRPHHDQGKGDVDDNAARAAVAAAAVIDRFMHDPRNNVIRIAQQPDLYEQEQAPHIFNHKTSGIRLEEMEAQNGGMMYPAGQQDQNQNSGYAAGPQYPYNNQGAMSSWQGNNNPPPPPPPVVAPSQAPPVLYKEPTTTEAAPLPTQPPPCEPEKHADAPAKETPPVTPEPASKNHHSESKQSAGTAVAEKNVKNTVDSYKARAESEHQADQPAVSHQQQQNNHVAILDHVRRVKPVSLELEGMSRPKGAIISLALGLSVTAVMAVLIACRLKVVKRRGGRRGGHDSYAHDSDYLVNGMYL